MFLDGLDYATLCSSHFLTKDFKVINEIGLSLENHKYFILGIFQDLDASISESYQDREQSFLWVWKSVKLWLAHQQF